jgi:phosphoribosylformimino-5-aminoimidazole carboxamide ribonucleotide (ProFAR) isomerase
MKNQFDLLYENIVTALETDSEINLEKPEVVDEEEIKVEKEYDFKGYKIVISSNTDKDGTYYGFEIYEYDENNIREDFPIFDCAGCSEFESIEDADDAAQDWIYDWEDDKFNDDDSYDFEDEEE